MIQLQRKRPVVPEKKGVVRAIGLERTLERPDVQIIRSSGVEFGWADACRIAPGIAFPHELRKVPRVLEKVGLHGFVIITGNRKR